MFLYGVFVYCRGWKTARHEAPYGGKKFLAPAVVESECKNQPIIAPRSLDCLQHGGPKLCTKPVQTADMAKLRPLPVKLLRFPLDHTSEDMENSFDLLARTTPVVCRESPEREIFHADFRGRGRDATDVVRAVLVARQPRQSSLRRPTSIAVHDDSDVTRDLRTTRRGCWTRDVPNLVARCTHDSAPWYRVAK